MAQNSIIEPESALDFVEHRLIAFDVQQNVVCLVNLVDRMGKLTAAPVFGAMNCPA